MSSIFFQFYYDDGKMRPFDPDVALERDSSQFQVPEVSADGLIDIFNWSKAELVDLGLSDARFCPPFVLDFDEDAPDQKLGVEENIWGENMTIPIEPTDLKIWAKLWIFTLSKADNARLEELLPYNAKHAEEVLETLHKIELQANCALDHGVKIMLFVAW